MLGFFVTTMAKVALNGPSVCRSTASGYAGSMRALLAVLMGLLMGCSGADVSPLESGDVSDGGCNQDALTVCFAGEQKFCGLSVPGTQTCNACGEFDPCSSKN